MVLNSNAPIENIDETNPNPGKKSAKKNILINILIVFLAIIFVFVSYISIKMYRQIKEMKEIFSNIEEMSNYANSSNLPKPQQKLISSVKSDENASRLFVGFGDGKMPANLMNADDTKTLIENARKIEQKKIIDAMNKYSERPIVKEFMNDLKKDPNFQKALEAKNSNNPMAVIGNINKIKNMKEIVGKYAMRPDFMKLMLDIMRDTEMKPLFKMMPVGMTPGVSNFDIKSIETEIKNENLNENLKLAPTVFDNNDSKKSSQKKVIPPPLEHE
ncbi:MAG: hypothetical protein L6420_11905 [Elusimicrobia bacterium]|nr:hypothetical protein [Elusimicrobiota bacterium]